MKNMEYLPPTNEVWSKVMFLRLSVILLTGWGGGLHPWGGGCNEAGGGVGRRSAKHYGMRSTSRRTYPTGMHSLV